MRKFNLEVPSKRNEFDLKTIHIVDWFDMRKRVSAEIDDDGSYLFEYESGTPSHWDSYCVTVVVNGNNTVNVRGSGSRKFRGEILDNLFWLKKALSDKKYSGLIEEIFTNF